MSSGFIVKRAIDSGPRVGLFALALLAGVTLSSGTQDAVANGDTRTLSMVHSHTGESLTITYKRGGSFDSAALEKLNWFLRDWRVDEQITMAPQLFDVVWAVYREVGADEPIRIMSAYRSPGTNAMLRRRSRAVAKESHHMRGNAMDVHIPGVSMAKAREIGMRLQAGGVGYYPSAGSPFVHLDVGSVRSWPRMSRDQLERIFPDGKTVHLPKDGVPLANYQAALAEVQARGGSALDYETVTTTRGPSLWALLFGSGTDEDAGEVNSRSTRQSAGRTRRGGSSSPEQVASLNSDNVMNPGIVAPLAPAPRTPLPRQTAAEPVPAETAPPPPIAAPAPGPEKKEAVVQIASLPVPPIRPRGAQFDRLVAASDPLPPIRPASLTSFSGQPVPAAESVSPSPAAVAAPGMPLPPLRPVLVAALPEPPSPPILLAVSAPLPPARPAIAAENPAPLPAIVARAEVASASPLVQSYAAIAAPVPPSRPVPILQQAIAAPHPPSAPPASPPQQSAVPPPKPVSAPGFAPVPVATVSAPAPRRVSNITMPVRSKADAALVSHPAAEARPAAVPVVAEPPVAREINSAVVAMKLSTNPAPATGGFSGGFIRPLGASFTRTGE